MCPKLLTSDVKSELAPVFSFLSDELHISDSNVRKVINKCPMLLVSSVRDQLRPTLIYLRRLGFSDVKALAYRDAILLVSDVESTLMPKLEFLIGLGMMRDYLYCGSPLYDNLSPQRVREWIAYHVKLFGKKSHFVIYDAGGVHREVLRVLKPCTEKGFVTLHDVRDQEMFDGYYHNQFLVVNDCLHKYRFDAKWMFFFDVDEFIYVDEKSNLDGFMKSMEGFTQFTIEQMPMPSKLCLMDDLGKAGSSVGASSPALPTNIGIADWFGPKAAASQTGVVPQPPKTSVSTSAIAGGSTRGSSKPSCRPWERGDLLCRLGTFKPSNWSGKPKEASSLSCARRGWVNVDIDKIECEACSAHLTFPAITSLMPKDVDNEVEAFVENLDSGHKVACPWRGNCCADSLVQFPPTPPSALIGGYKDRCDGLLQFECLPIIASSAIETIKLSRATQIDRFLSLPHSLSCGDLSFKTDDMPLTELSRDDVFTRYSNAQKLISLCGWEPRWLANLQDCEEHSAQSTKNAYSFFPSEDRDNSSHFLESNKKDKGKRIMDSAQESRPISKSPLLDCSLCGTTVRVLDFLLLPRPARFCNTPDTAKKTILTRGTSAASGIGWVADGIEKENIDEVNEGKSLPNAGVDLNLTMAGGLPSTNFAMPVMSENLVGDNCIGRDLIIGQPSASAIGDRAASYESRGLSTNRKRNLEEGGSTVDRPQDIVQRADSIEGTVIDRDTDEIDDGTQDDSEGPAKRSRRLDLFETYHSSLRVDSSGAGPSRNFSLDIDIDVNRTIGHPSARDSTRASSVVAMDTIGNGADEDSMESVENYPGDFDDVHLPSPSLNRNLDTEPNYSNQAQQSTCAQPLAAREMESSSTNEGEELLNAETVNANARDRLSIGVSGGSVGMGASHEAEIHGADVYLHRADSIVGDAEPIIAEVVENAGQMGESAPGPGLMDESVPGDMGAQQGDSQDVMSQLVGKADSGSKIYGSTKEDSDESGKKTSFNVGLDSNVHPSLSCNAMISYGRDMSKEEVTQNGNSVMDYDFVLENGLANGENDFVAEPREFDPIKYHNTYCPWVNGNVAAAGCDSSGDSNSGSSLAICGWQLTLDALDNPQSLGIGPNQYMQSESAASQYKDDHLTPHPSLLKRHASSKSQGYR